MARKIIWAPDALIDLERLAEYISRDSPNYAADMVRRVYDAVQFLSTFAHLGRRVPELSDDAIRELIVRNYRVIYRVREHEITIAAVIHGARHLPNAVKDRPL